MAKIADELLGEVSITTWFTILSHVHFYFISKLFLQSFLNECCLNGEMVGSTSEVMEPSYNIDLPNADINNDDQQLFMLKTDTDTVKMSAEEMHYLTPKVEIKSEIEEHFDDESNSLERFIIVEEAVEEVTTTYDEHILEMCQEDNSMDTDQYEDIGYESLSSPEYEYKTHYITP